LSKGNINHFELLKQKLVANMQQLYPGINPSIADWKGQEITDFQEDLLTKVNANLSEKWFYNHIKSENKSLPRIDVLNLLSKYVGYANWDDFVFNNSNPEKSNKTIIKANQYFIIVPLMILGVMAILLFVFNFLNKQDYIFSFYDVHTKEAVTGSPIEIKLLVDDESPINYFSDTSGNFILNTDKKILKMVVSAPYYKTDTITRILKTFEKEQKIGLYPNDYALIIHYFSQMNVDDWQKRRDYLSTIIDDGAMIYQVLNDQNAQGMELYNKEEFINKLTIPSGSLKNIEILETKFKGEKIIILRFWIKEKK